MTVMLLFLAVRRKKKGARAGDDLVVSAPGGAK
jgi:hypothetical protein